MKQVEIQEGVTVQTVFASDVASVNLLHENKRIFPRNFSVSPEKRSFKARLPLPISLRLSAKSTELIKMKAVQLPFVVNNATTGHKLQGSSVKKLFVHDWNYSTNWPYVVLSRIRTSKGLYLRRPVSRDLTKYKVPPKLKALMRRLRKKSPSYS